MDRRIYTSGRRKSHSKTTIGVPLVRLPDCFVASSEHFLRLLDRFRAVVDLDNRLPAWPFKAPSGFVAICEFDDIFGGFGRVLERLAEFYGDAFVMLLGVDRISFYRSRYGIWPALQFEASSVREEYWGVLHWDPEDGFMPELGHAVDVVAIAGSSGRWGVWGQRDWEVGLLLTPDRAGPWCDEGVRFFGRDLDLDDIRGPEGWTLPLTEDMLAEFWGNFDRRGMG